jgi:membrane-associated protein
LHPMSAMFDSLVQLVSGSPWTYALVLGVAALDAVFPLVPSETTAIAAGVLAGIGELSIALVVVAAATGAFAGDSATYGLGRAFGPRALRRLPERRTAWAERMLAAHAAALIVLARFVPGGRTATMATAGAVRLRWLRFERLAAVAAVLWASYAAMLGFLGGRSFEERPWLGALLAFGLAAALGLAVEGVRRLRRSPAHRGSG